MKNISIFLLVSLLITFIACNPIEKREELGAKLTPDQLDLKIEATTSGGNKLIVQNNTPGVNGYWEHQFGKISGKKSATVIFPLVGTHTFKFTGTSAGGIVETTVDVTINQLDNELDEEWVNLAGSFGKGKTWVYATDYPGNDVYPANAYCFMVADYDVEEFWWDPYEGGGAPDGVDKELKFDLTSGPAITLYENDGDAIGEKGAFSFDPAAMTINVTAPYIPDYDEPNLNPDMTATGEYQILSLTENELVLTQNQADWGYNWIWIFKTKGYNYPTK